MTTLRVAGHVHSTWSYDGRWSLEDLSRAFARRGYGAVLMSEHDRTFDAERWEAYREACATASAAGALLVPGIEYSDAQDTVHVPVWGVDTFLGAGRPTGEMLEEARARDGVSIIAHPGRRDVAGTADPAWARLASGIEIWNRKYDGYAPGAGGLALARRFGLPPFVGLDFHSARQFFPLAMCGPVAGPLTPAAVIGALRAGDLAPKVSRLGAEHVMQGAGLRAACEGERLRLRVARVLRAAGH